MASKIERERKKNTTDPYDGNDSISFDISKSQSQKSKVKNLFSIDPERRIMTEGIHDKNKHATITTKLRNFINVSVFRLK